MKTLDIILQSIKFLVSLIEEYSRWRAKKAALAEIEAEILKKRMKLRRLAKEIDREVDDLDPDDLARRMQRYQRDG